MKIKKLYHIQIQNRMFSSLDIIKSGYKNKYKKVV